MFENKETLYILYFKTYEFSFIFFGSTCSLVVSILVINNLNIIKIKGLWING